MPQFKFFYIRITLIIGALYFLVIANTTEKGFKEKLLDYIDETAQSEETILRLVEPTDTLAIDQRYDSLTYRNGDWDEYIISSLYKDYDEKEKRLKLIEGSDVTINTYGSFDLDLSYGMAMFTKKRYQQNEEDKPVSLVIKDGFRPKQELQLHIEGKIGDRMTVYIDHDDRKKDNHYVFKYKAIRDEELIRELNVGEIDINFQGSKYAVYDNNTAKGLGIDFTLKKNKFMFKGFASVTQGRSEIEIFRGNSSPSNIKLSEYQFIRGVYYQIEPLVRYNNILNPPYPPGYALQAVNINPYGFELWMDDQDPNNNSNAIQLPLDNGYYTKLQAGIEYKINYISGLITFLKPTPAKARIFAVYTLAGTTSTDSYALQPSDARHPGGIFAGKIFVYIKYGYSLTADPVPGQDHTRQDLYEVRSFYNIGDRYILPNNFNLLFYLENGLMTASDVASLGKYSIDYTNGIIQFIYREPFKQLLIANSTATFIYTENQPANVYNYSRYRIKVDYYKEARSFQLSHPNIIPGSVTIKVDGRKLPDTLFSLDATAGYITFTTPSDPLIGPETIIEIRYEYYPFQSQSQEFVGGFRAEYEFSRDLKLGGSLLYSRTSGNEKIPVVGDTPSQTVFFEGDSTLHLDGRRIAQFLSLFTDERIKSVPVEINGYAEYARSYKNVNTFGKALIDNMESNEESISLSLNERDWQYSSPPVGVSVRGILNYYFYRDINNPAILKGPLFSAPKIDYSIKSGPYNVAIGHLADPISSLSAQLSLVLDFADNFVTNLGDYVSLVTRSLSKDVVDLSGIQYVEISYLYEGTVDANLYLDVGQVNEDADGDNVLITEDLNRNGVIDTDPSTGYTEDIGYLFNEPGHPPTRIGGGAGLNQVTRGDGVLSSEDLNGNGVLDKVENVFSFQGQSITLTAGSAGWQIGRMFIDPSILTQSDINILKQVQSVRLYIKKANGVKGRVYIDGIKFVSSKWRDPRLDANPASPTQLKVVSINNLDDNEYRWESFSIMMKDLYESMYGIESYKDLLKEKESALKIEYAIPAGHSSATVSRRFTKPIDIRDYRALSIWCNFRSFNPGDRVGVVLGSSDTDFVAYEMNMDFPHVWREMKLRLKSNSGGYVLPSGISGIPDLKRIIYVKIMVISSAPPSSGVLWIDDIYLSDPIMQQDSAHWYEGEIKITQPLFRTKGGVPILSDVSVKYIDKGHGAKFSTIGKKDLDMSEASKQLFTSFNILPNWYTKIDFFREESKTDSLNEEVEESKRGKTSKNSVMMTSDYVSDSNGVPSIKILYRYDDYNNTRDERISSIDVKRAKSQINHAPVIRYQQTADGFLWGKLSQELLLNMFFKKDETNRKSYEADYQTLSTLTSLVEIEKRQRSELKYGIDYTHKYVYLRPGFQLGSEEVVTFLGQSQANSTAILYYVNGDFHVPFFYNKNCKFVDRSKILNISAGINDFGYIAPGIKLDIQYFDNNFRDYDISLVPSQGYKRSRDARTLLSTSINIPIFFNKTELLKSIRSFTILYNRSLYLTEASVPFEGERKDPFEERYGISRTVSGLANAAFNIFQYYPFYFYLGRNNYANGRDYLYTKLNMPVLYANGSTVVEYANNLRLLDNFALNWSLDFNKITVTSNTSLVQVCERQNVTGVPVQIITPSLEINFNFDLMKLFNFGPFRPNREGIPFHSAFLSIGYTFKSSMFVTSNYDENIHTPSAGFAFKRDRLGITCKFGVDIKQKISHAYISFNLLHRSFKDQKYIDNMSQYVFYRDKDTGYVLSVMFETDVMWIYKFFLLLYRLNSFPIFTLEYSMKMNRYEYASLVRPEPYDQHLISTKLTLDLHKNIQGALRARFALEQYRNRYTINISREIFSFEVGGNFTLRF